MSKRDPWVVIGMGIVAVVAIAASFATLMHTAIWVGWDPRIAWMLPLCLDVLAIAAGRVWLSTAAADHARRYARAVSMAALVTSIAGNAIGHITGMQDASTVKIVLAIIVGSIPPAALAAVGHLATLATMQVAEPEPVVEEIVAESIESAQDVVEPAPIVEQPEPGQQPRKRGRPALKEPAARAAWDAARAEGRMPSGVELARAADADDKMGRTWKNRWVQEEKDLQAQNNKTVTSLTLVNA